MQPQYKNTLSTYRAPKSCEILDNNWRLSIRTTIKHTKCDVINSIGPIMQNNDQHNEYNRVLCYHNIVWSLFWDKRTPNINRLRLTVKVWANIILTKSSPEYLTLRHHNEITMNLHGKLTGDQLTVSSLLPLLGKLSGMISQIAHTQTHSVNC